MADSIGQKVGQRTVRTYQYDAENVFTIIDGNGDGFIKSEDESDLIFKGREDTVWSPNFNRINHSYWKEIKSQDAEMAINQYMQDQKSFGWGALIVGGVLSIAIGALLLASSLSGWILYQSPGNNSTNPYFT